MAGKSLQELLAADEDYIDENMESEVVSEEENEADVNYEDAEPVAEGNCVECGDMPRELFCQNCEEPFCKVCFGFLHRTGKRKEHAVVVQKKSEDMESQDEGNFVPYASKEAKERAEMEANGTVKLAKEITEEPETTGTDTEADDTTSGPVSASIVEKIANAAKYVPLRLTAEERQLMRLLEAALNVSEYTDRVDIIAYSSKAKRIVAQLKEMCSILAGLVVASNLKIGQDLLVEKNFHENARWYKKIFELGRRYKIMNPEKMRDTYGKLIYMIMDSRLPEIKEHMEFDFYKPIVTVYSFLSGDDASVDAETREKRLALLKDEHILNATAEIVSDGKPRPVISREIKQKERAIEYLASRYSGKGTGLSKEDIRQALYSLGDYHAYINANAKPVKRMIERLESFFEPELDHSQESASKFSLAISYGRGGARLSHDHERQYYYVKQSLSLWTIIMRDMIKLWFLADEDLLSNSDRYRLLNTGQGLNRVKSCPLLSRAMHQIINEARRRNGTWIGSSVVHLGDHAVPNGLFFLDKYVQVPKILNPIDLVLKGIEKERDPYVLEYINRQFGSVEMLQKTVLCDFFKHGFDGSGADNFYDAGSCIDGRLTSAWNWTNTISKKNYYRVFMMCGFIGFNGIEGF